MIWDKRQVTSEDPASEMPPYAISIRDFPIFGSQQDSQAVLSRMDRCRNYEIGPAEFVRVKYGCALGPNLTVFGRRGYLASASMRGVTSLVNAQVTKVAPGRYQFPEDATARRYKRPIVVVGGKATASFFHWMTEVVPRIQLAKNRFQDRTIVVRPLKSAFQRESLEILSVSPEEVDEHIVTAPEVWFPSHLVRTTLKGWLSPDLIGLAQEFASLVCNRNDRRGERIYISRRDTPGRRAGNEDDIMGVLGTFGFRLVRLAEMPLRDQVRLFRSAEAVVAPHGAGLVWTLYCSPGTKVIEFFPAGFESVSVFWSIANLAGLDYTMCVVPGAHGNTELEVDIPLLEMALRDRGIAPQQARTAGLRIAS